MTGEERDPLDRVLDGSAPAFALLHRPQTTGAHTVEVLLARPGHHATLADLPLSTTPESGEGHELLVVVPHRQITERGYAAHDDAAPLTALTVTAQGRLSLGEVLRRLPDEPVKTEDEGFDLSDEEYADLARRVIAEEIGTGDGANFVIQRSFTAWLPDVRAALAGRHAEVAGFWLGEPENPAEPPPAPLEGRRVLVIDAEDTCTAMLARQIQSLGVRTQVRRFDEEYDVTAYDAVVLGPGPGDPAQPHPKITQLRATAARLLAERRPFLAVCLSHRVLGGLLGLPLVRRAVPNQGVRREIDLFGRREHVGFDNTYAARCDEDVLDHPVAGRVEVSRDPVDGDVYALRGAGFTSTQFHAESVLTRDGPRILGALLAHALRQDVRTAP